MKTWYYRKICFEERMELVSEASSMNTYRYVTHKNGIDSLNDVVPGGGNDLRGEIGKVNDLKGKQQHHVHNSKYDGGHNSNGVSRYRSNNTLSSNGMNRDLKNEMNNDSNSNSNTTSMTSNSNHIKFFKTKMCPWHFNGRCVRAQGCSYAHCESELRPVFKTKICDYIADGNCPHGGMCIFAHSSEELKPRLNAGDFQRSPFVYEQQKSKGRQRNANVASPDIQLRENDHADDQQQHRDGRAGNNREFYVRHDSAKTKFGSHSSSNNDQYFHYKNKFNHYSKTADEQQRCASSVTTRIFDSDSGSNEYGRSMSTMESMSDPVFHNCDIEKCVCQPASSPSSISDCVIATPFSSASLNIPLTPSLISGSLVNNMQSDSSCSASPNYSPIASWALQGPSHLSLSSSGSSPVAMSTFLGGMGGTPSPMAAHYWLQCANTGYISNGNDMLVHHSLYRGGEVPSLRDPSLNMISNSCAQVPSPQIAVHLLSLNSQPSDTLASMSSDENLLMQGSFNASVEELNAARPAFYED